ncbi:MAG TPA: peptide-methionine (S)-S-oxide reductase MsrA [Bryobacteraceae bacterium]|nr:peptide-methionine (S)-S-oxide reductase MsrA [Bryobacteraceae bacterium]
MHKTLLPLWLAAAMAGCATSAMLPDPAVDIDRAAQKHQDTAVFAGGCFWGVEAVFEQLAGVDRVLAGFAGGDAISAHYEIVGSGLTHHAESVEIAYDPTKISYGQLLKIFFAVAHDPTQKNRQGPDSGPQYRSAIFYKDLEQKRIAEAYIKQLGDAQVFKKPIVTEVTALSRFYPAEGYHQQFVKRNPDYPYVVYNDLPKLAMLKKEYAPMLKTMLKNEPK